MDDETARRIKREAKLARPKLATRGSPLAAAEPDWKDRSAVEAQESLYATAQPRLLLLGDSIAKAWPEEDLGSLGLGPAANLGVSGYLVQHVLWRLGHTAIDLSAAEAVVILAGTNNLSVADPLREIAQGLRAVVRLAAVKAPKAEIYVMQPPPRRARGERLEEKRGTLGARLAAMAPKEGFVLVAAPDLPENAYRDNIHLAPEGYGPLTNALRAAMRPGSQSSDR